MLFTPTNALPGQRVSEGFLVADPDPDSGDWMSPYEGLAVVLFTAQCTTTNVVYEGDWEGVDHGYLGVSVVENGTNLCGWFCLSVSNGNVLVHDYAYESTFGEPIHAGRTASRPSFSAIHEVGAGVYLSVQNLIPNAQTTIGFTEDLSSGQWTNHVDFVPSGISTSFVFSNPVETGFYQIKIEKE